MLTYQKEQIEAFIHIDHAQSHFLFHTFSRVHYVALQSPPEVAGMIYRLQKITNFTLNQYQYTQVDIDKEIQILKEFIELEEEGTRQFGRYLIEVTGETAGKKVDSFILLPLVENIFSQQVNKNDATDLVAIRLSVIKDVLKVEIENSKPHQTSTLTNGKRDSIYQIKNAWPYFIPAAIS